MKIAIVAPSPVPFTPGGAEAVWMGILREISDNSPHDVELIKLPVAERTLPEVMDAYRAFSHLDLSHFDLVVSGKYPAWMVRHPRHVVYLLHPLRGLYDSYDHFGLPRAELSGEPAVRTLLTRATNLGARDGLGAFFDSWDAALLDLGPDHPILRFPGPLARSLVHSLDRSALQPDQIARYLAISRTVAHRPEYFPRDAVVKVVYPPSDLRGLHYEPGEFFFTTSRHDQPKRLDLLIAAMQHYRGTARLVIGGEGPETPRLKELAAEDPRIEFVGRLSRPALVDHYARSIGVPFIPADEDLGLITLEAMASGKPVLTTTDSGGPTEFVRPDLTGVSTNPNPVAIGAGLARLEKLAALPQTADAARSAVSKITWKAVVDELTKAPAASVPMRTGRPRIVVASTYQIWPPRGGGQLRAFHLYGALAEHFDVEVLCLATTEFSQSVRRLGPGFVERVIPRTEDHQRAANEISQAAGFPVTDIVDGQLLSLTPAYCDGFAAAAQGSAAIILAEPYLAPLVGSLRNPPPVIYDAYNCEYVLKSQMLPPTETGVALLDRVREQESQATEVAQLVGTVSVEDQAHIQRLYGTDPAKFVTIPNGVDLSATPFTPFDRRVVNRGRWLARLKSTSDAVELTRLALFIGSWHLPNNEAGGRIVEMATALPQVGFILAGRHTETLDHRNVPENVFLMGAISEGVKRAILGCADVALAPLATGSGTNLKVIEYLAAGAPVVSTAVGLRGVELDPALARSADLDGFPAAVAEELAFADRHPQEVARRTLAARLAVEGTYGWSALGDRLAAAIGQLLRSGTLPPDGLHSTVVDQAAEAMK